jgi:hypothetical protein
MFVMQIKNLKKLDKIVCNVSGKECISFMEMLQISELGGSKGHEHEVFICPFTNNLLLNNNS